MKTLVEYCIEYRKNFIDTFGIPPKGIEFSETYTVNRTREDLNEFFEHVMYNAIKDREFMSILGMEVLIK